MLLRQGDLDRDGTEGSGGAAAGAGGRAAPAALGRTSDPPGAVPVDDEQGSLLRRQRLEEQRQQLLARQKSKARHSGIFSASAAAGDAAAGVPQLPPGGGSAGDRRASAPPNGGRAAGASRDDTPGSVNGLSAIERALLAQGMAPSFDPSAPAGASARGSSGSPVPLADASGPSRSSSEEGVLAADSNGALAMVAPSARPEQQHAAAAQPASSGMFSVVGAGAGADAGDGVQGRLFGSSAAGAAAVMAPPPRGGMVQCQVVRDRSGWRKMYPHYTVTDTATGRLLMMSRKRQGNKTSNYVIATDEQGIDDKESQSQIGKVRANFLGTEFTVFDHGLNPKDVPQARRAAEPEVVRRELVAIAYENNVLGSRGPRRMLVIIPEVSEADGRTAVFRPLNDAETLHSRYKRGELSGMTVLRNKAPKWNDDMGAYVLNFNGRVSLASVKNFQLVVDEDPDTVLLQFGRVSENEFTMDFRWPLSAAQAFGICISSFDSKLACE